MGVSNFDVIVANDIVGAGGNPFGTKYYVASATFNGGDGNSGKSPKEPFATIAKAIAVAAEGDTIVLSPETHSVDVSAAALTPTVDHLTFLGAIPCHGGKPRTIITHDADDGANLVAIDVSGTVFKDIEFLLVAGGTTALTLFDVAQTTAVVGLSFINCWFNLNSVDAAGVSGLTLDDATTTITGMVMNGCRFLGGDATTNTCVYIDVGVGGIPAALIENCTFQLESADGDAVGINFADPVAAGKHYATVIKNNDFIGPSDGGADAVGIVFASAGDEDQIILTIRTNYFSNTSDSPVTVDEVPEGMIQNYYGDDTAGGTLVVPGT